MIEQFVEVVVIPLNGICGPCAFEAARNGVNACAGAERTYPAEALRFDSGTLRLGTAVLACIGSAMGFAEGVSAGDEGYGLLIIHRHAGEGFPDIASRGGGIGFAVGAFRIHIDQAHLNGSERIGKLAVASVALVGQPLALGAPGDVFFGLPNIFASTGETESLESHRFEGNVPGKDHQIRPGDLPAVLLLDRPK